jgi:hypothetical protein
MQNRLVGLTVGVVAAVVLAAAVSVAAARNLSVSNQSLRVVFTPVTFNAEGTVEVRCNLTLEGSFHYRTIVKREGALGGLITRATLARPCSRGVAWVYNGTERNERLGNTTLPNTLPWHISYEGFAGTLPNITAVRLLLSGVRFLAEAGILCNYTTGTGAGGNSSAIASLGPGGAVTGLRADETRRIRSETAFCPEGSFVGNGVVTLLGTANSVFIRLI